MSKLQIHNLETGFSLLPGNLYLICEEDNFLATRLIWTTLIASCDGDGTACLITASDVAKSINESGMANHADMLIASNRLRVLEMLPQRKRRPGKQAITAVIEEIRYWRAADKSLLIIDGADQLISEIDMGMLQDWRNWAEQSQQAVLLIVRQNPHDNNSRLTALLPIAHLLSGMARIKSRYGVGSWEVFHWFEDTGIVAGKVYPIHCNAAGKLEAQTDATEPATSIVTPATDEEEIWIVNSPLLAKEHIAPTWHVVDTINEILADTSSIVAATIVIPFTPHTNFSDMAKGVFNLRKQCGPRLKIVLREINARLRYSQESLVIRFGVNIIAGSESSHSRFLNMIVMVQSQVFPHALPATYEQAVEETHPVREYGYLPPQEFCRAVHNTMEHSHILHIRNVLVRLPVVQGLLPLDVLRYCKMIRPGDLCSADDDSVYLFLYACQEADIELALDRLFGLPVSELFSTEELFLAAYDIRGTIDNLDNRHRRHSYADLSVSLSHVGDDASQKKEPVRPVQPTAENKPGAVVHVAPKPAVRHPLTTQRKIAAA